MAAINPICPPFVPPVYDVEKVAEVVLETIFATASEGYMRVEDEEAAIRAQAREFAAALVAALPVLVVDD